MHDFIETYLSKMVTAIQALDRSSIAATIEAIERCGKAGGTIFIIGNGGSAATASHMANDLSGGLKLREIRRFRVVSLADNVALNTAIANDIGYENVFYAQLKDQVAPHDLLIAISCSGNSPNIVKAVRYCKTLGVPVVGLTGFDGGELRAVSDVSYHVPTDRGEYGVVEDLHMVLDHVIYSFFVSLKPGSSTHYSLR